MNKFAVFIDRDGVINHDPGNFHKINELQVLPRVGRAIRLLNIHNIPAIVVTNQSVVARGWITEEEVQRIHSKISEVLENDNATITKYYYCPHHPQGSVKKFSITCNCRKPALGMFNQAQKEFGIDLKSSFVVGDSFREIEAARQMGCTSIEVSCGRSDFRNLTADYAVKDLYSAVKLIINKVKEEQNYPGSAFNS